MSAENAPRNTYLPTLEEVEMERAGLRVRLLMFILVVPFALVACSDSTGVEDDHGEEVEGVQIWLSGAMIASYDNDEKTWFQDYRRKTRTLEVTV